MPSSLVTAGVRRKASTPLLKMGRPPSAAEAAGRWWGGVGRRCGAAEVRRWCGGGGAAVVQNGELQEHGGVEDGEAGWEGGLARTAPGSTGVDLPHLRSVCGADAKGCGERVQSACCAERVQSTCKARAELVRGGCSAGAVPHCHEVVPLGLQPREQVGDVRVLDEHVGVEEDGLVVRGARE